MHRHLHHGRTIPLCFFKIALPHDVAQQNSACTGHAKAKNGAQLPDNHNQRVCRHRIIAKVAQNHGIHGECQAPDHIVSGGRHGQPDKILSQQFVPDKEKAKIQLHILRQGRNNQISHHLSHPGQGCRGRHTGGTQSGRAEQAEDKGGVQQNVQKKRHQMQYHTDGNPAHAPQHRGIDFRNAPADVRNAHNPQIPGADLNQLRVVCEYQHHFVWQQERAERNQNRQQHGKPQSDSLHRPDRPHILFPVILGAEQGRAGAQPIKHIKQDSRVVCRQRHRRNGGLAHIVQHDDIGGADCRAQQILNHDGGQQLAYLLSEPGFIPEKALDCHFIIRSPAAQ